MMEDIFDLWKKSFIRKNAAFYHAIFVSIGFILALVSMIFYYLSDGSLKWKQITETRASYEHNQEMLLYLVKEHPNLPIEYWIKVRDNHDQYHFENDSCAPFPDIMNLNISQDNWQTVNLSGHKVNLYSAHYDSRKKERFVRILAVMTRNIVEEDNVYCQIWNNDRKEPVIVKANITISSDESVQNSTVIFVDCKLTESPGRPEAVSIVTSPCSKAKNVLKIIYEVPEKKEDFAICVPRLDYLSDEISPLKLAEWLESLNMFGVDKVFMYEFKIHPDLRKVLEYYQNLQRVEFTPHYPQDQNKFPSPLLNKTSADNSLSIISNNCFYRNMYKYRFILFLDFGEIIVPRNETSWFKLLEKLVKIARNESKSQFVSYNVDNVLFLDRMTPLSEYSSDIPTNFHMLQNVYREKNMTKLNSKSFYDTRFLDNYKNPKQSLNGSYYVPEDLALVHTYRRECPQPYDQCQNMKDFIKDNSLWKFKDKIIKRVQNVMLELELY